MTSLSWQLTQLSKHYISLNIIFKNFHIQSTSNYVLDEFLTTVTLTTTMTTNTISFYPQWLHDNRAGHIIHRYTHLRCYLLQSQCLSVRSSTIHSNRSEIELMIFMYCMLIWRQSQFIQHAIKTDKLCLCHVFYNLITLQYMHFH